MTFISWSVQNDVRIKNRQENIDKADKIYNPWMRTLILITSLSILRAWIQFAPVQVVGESSEAYPGTPRGQWVIQWPGQAVLCVSSKYWTSYVHEAIRKGGHALEEYLIQNNQQIDEIVKIVRGKLSKQNRTTLQALIVMDVHARDVLIGLVKESVSSEEDFVWLSQLRYYWEVRKPNSTFYCLLFVTSQL